MDRARVGLLNGKLIKNAHVRPVHCIASIHVGKSSPGEQAAASRFQCFSAFRAVRGNSAEVSFDAGSSALRPFLPAFETEAFSWIGPGRTVHRGTVTMHGIDIDHAYQGTSPRGSMRMDLGTTALLTERLSLKAFALADAPDIFAAVTPTLTRFLRFDPAADPETCAQSRQDWPVQMAGGTDLYLVARCRSTDAFAGTVSLRHLARPEPMVGVWIKETWHGLGYGGEAVLAMLGWAARELAVAAVAYPVVVENRPSRKLAERLGGRIVGAGQLTKRSGAVHPLVIYTIALPAAAREAGRGASSGTE